MPVSPVRPRRRRPPERPRAPRSVVALAVALVAVVLAACAGRNDGYSSNVHRFFHRADALGLRLPPTSVARANLMNRNPCAYNVDLSDQLRADPTYFSNRTRGLSTTDALLATALEVAVFCPGRYSELRSFVAETRTPIPSKRCMLRHCADVSLADAGHRTRARTGRIAGTA